MVDFDEINNLLDEAGCDLQSVEKIYEIVRSQIDAAPADQRPGLYVQFTNLCHERATKIKEVLDAHIAAAKTAFRTC